MANSQNGALTISEHMFTNLLASAYSLQQRHDRVKSSISQEKSSEVISSVLDMQALIGRRAIHLDTAMHLVATRSQKLCGAAGTAIALLDGENLDYKAASGIAEPLLGAKILADTSSSFRQLELEEVVQSDTWKDKALSTKVIAKSVLSVPIRRNRQLAGCIQLFSRAGRFAEESIYACELMSTILTQLVEDPEFSFNDDQNGDGEEKTATVISRERTLSTPVALETSDAGKPWQMSKQPQGVPSSETNLCQGSVTNHVDAELKNLPAEFQKEDFGRTQQSQKLDATSEHTCLLNARSADQLPIQQAGAGTNDNPPDFGYTFSKTFNATARVTAMLYPGLVLLFVAIANMLGERRGWPLDLATVIIVYFTAVEVWKRW